MHATKRSGAWYTGIQRAVARMPDWLRRAGTILVQSVRDLITDSASQSAAAIAYYSLLSAFPLLLAAASIAAFFVDPNWAVDQATKRLGDFLPQGQSDIARIVKGAITARGPTGFFSIIALLWTGSRVFSALTRALNIAFDVDETYGFLKRLLIELVMLLTIGLLFVLALVSQFLIDILRRVLHILPAHRGFAFSAIQTAVSGLLLLVALFLIYRFVPRSPPNWRAAAVGAAVATLLFLVARPLFLGYLAWFGRYNLIYGSIAIVIILVLWAWIVALITLFGGELTAHIQKMVIEGQSADAVGQLHQERAHPHTANRA